MSKERPETTQATAYFTTEYLEEFADRNWRPAGFDSLQNYADNETTKAFVGLHTAYGDFTIQAMQRLIQDQGQEASWRMRTHLTDLYYAFCDLTAPGTPTDVTIKTFSGELGDETNAAQVAAFHFEPVSGDPSSAYRRPS